MSGKNLQKAYRCAAATKTNHPISPLQGGDKGLSRKLTQTRPHETRPRENGEWGKEKFTQEYYKNTHENSWN